MKRGQINVKLLMDIVKIIAVLLLGYIILKALGIIN